MKKNARESIEHTANISPSPGHIPALGYARRASGPAVGVPTRAPRGWTRVWRAEARRAEYVGTEDNKAVVRRFIEDVVTGRDVDVADDVLAGITGDANPDPTH